MENHTESNGSWSYTIAAFTMAVGVLIAVPLALVYLPAPAWVRWVVVLIIIGFLGLLYVCVARPQQAGGSRDRGDGMG